MATQTAPRARFSSERKFFTGMALAMAATVFTGFAPTYYLVTLNPAPTPPLTPDVHIHSVLNTAWVLLLLLQTGLIAARRADIHRLTGVAGAALAAAILVSGILVAIDSERRVHSAANAGTLADPYVFLIYPIAAIGLFALFVAFGIAARRRPDYHKRWMMLATMSLIGPALARIAMRITTAVPGGFSALMLINLFLAALVIWDLRTRGRLHPVTLWGGGFLLISEPLRIAIGYSQAWQGLARTLMS